MKVRARISWFWAAWGFGFATWNGAVLIWGDGDWWWLNAIACALCLLSGIASVFEFSFRSGTTSRKAAPAVASSDLSRYLSGNYASGGLVSNSLINSQFTFHATPAPSTPPSAGEFKGLPFDFAIGEVYGLRMWRMDAYGRLRARNWDKAPPWRPGVNEAKCVERAEDDAYLRVMRSTFPSVYGTTTTPKPAPKPPHDTPSEDCAGGFYAYTESHHAETLPYKDSHVVLGVIKGTGRTLMGTKGFRCEKAEIIALRDPTRGGTKNDPWHVQQLANLKRVYPDVPLLASREALLEFAPLTSTMPDPSTDEFWVLP